MEGRGDILEETMRRTVAARRRKEPQWIGPRPMPESLGWSRQAVKVRVLGRAK
jgi:hypothetical protein